MKIVDAISFPKATGQYLIPGGQSISKEKLKTILKGNSQYVICKVDALGLRIRIIESWPKNGAGGSTVSGYVLYKDIIDPLLFNQPFTPETAKEMLELYANG